jgi:hypothetical protein
VPSRCTLVSSLRFPLRAGGTKPLRFPSRSGGNLKEGGIVNFGCAVGKCLCVGFSKCPPPNLPRTRGRSRDSLPACGEGWGGGAMFKSLCKDTYTNRQAKVHKKQQLTTPSVRFPLIAGGTKPLRFPSRSGGNLKEGGIVNFDCAVGKCLCVGFSKCPPPNLPRTRGRSRDSLPACGEGWGGGAMFKSLCKDTYL